MSHDSIRPHVRPKDGEPVHLMLTCLCDAFYSEVGIAVVECLEHLGYAVRFDKDQTCCGQPAFNTGDHAAALKVARHTIAVFRDAPVVVCPSGSCTAMIRWGYPQLFRGEPDFDEAIALAGKTWEITEFITQVAGVHEWKGSYNRRVVLHRSCHMRELTAGDAPVRLLSGIEGLTLCQLDTPEQCCGFGGTFTVTFPWTSNEMGSDKLCDFRDSGAEEIVSTDMGCVLHLRGLQRKNGSDSPAAAIPLRHLVEILDESTKAKASA